MEYQIKNNILGDINIMIYEKEKIKRIIEYKDSIEKYQVRKDIEWLIGCYNKYFIDSREYERQKREYDIIVNKYYNSEEEKDTLKNKIDKLYRKNKVLKDKYNESCKNNKNML